MRRSVLHAAHGVAHRVDTHPRSSRRGLARCRARLRTLDAAGADDRGDARRHRGHERREADDHGVSPRRSRATGAGVVIAPGGGFVALAISLEATELARWLQQRGVAAFVLKYRTIEKKVDGIPQMDMDTAGRYGIADGIQALKVVRAHAPEWGLARDRIGMIGFSAGAMVTSAAMLQRDPLFRPNFAALIYGAPFGKMPAIPAGLPPVFMAWAKDDNVALVPVVKFHDALVAAGQPPETHVYAKGGHGFGMKKQGTDSDHWIDDYERWLRAHGVIRS